MNRLASILPPAQVLVSVDSTSKKRAFEEAGLLFESQHGLSRALITDSLFARERLGSTGLGHGVAIPHGRIKGLKAPMAAAPRISRKGSLRKSADRGAADRGGADRGGVVTGYPFKGTRTMTQSPPCGEMASRRVDLRRAAVCGKARNCNIQAVLRPVFPAFSWKCCRKSAGSELTCASVPHKGRASSCSGPRIRRVWPAVRL